MRELALILPDDVWLTNLDRHAPARAVSASGVGSVALRASIPGPALELVGCARSQDAVAGFVAGAEGHRRRDPGRGAGSSLGGAAQAAAPAAPASATLSDADFIAQFQMVVAFDAAPVASEAGAAEVAPPPVGSRTGREHGRGKRGMNASNRLIVAILVVAALAIGFWMLLLGAEARRRPTNSAAEVDSLQVSLAEAQSRGSRSAEAAQARLPGRLPAAGRARQGGAGRRRNLLAAGRTETDRDAVERDLRKHPARRREAAKPPRRREPAPAAPVEPSRDRSLRRGPGLGDRAADRGGRLAAAARGDDRPRRPRRDALHPHLHRHFFHVADFIKGIDSLVHTGNSEIARRRPPGHPRRLRPQRRPRARLPDLDATFSVTTYVMPPGEGLTAGASPSRTGAAQPKTNRPTASRRNRRPMNFLKKGPELKLSALKEIKVPGFVSGPLLRPQGPPPAAARGRSSWSRSSRCRSRSASPRLRSRRSGGRRSRAQRASVRGAETRPASWSRRPRRAARLPPAPETCAPRTPSCQQYTAQRRLEHGRILRPNRPAPAAAPKKAPRPNPRPNPPIPRPNRRRRRRRTGPRAGSGTSPTRSTSRSSAGGSPGGEGKQRADRAPQPAGADDAAEPRDAGDRSSWARPRTARRR